MDTSTETREAAIDRIGKLWLSEPGKYWEALRKAKLESTDVFPELTVKGVVMLPDLHKDEQTRKSKR